MRITPPSVVIYGKLIHGGKFGSSSKTLLWKNILIKEILTKKAYNVQRDFHPDPIKV